MKNTSFKKIRILSLILGFFYCGGMIWFFESFLSLPLLLILLFSSTGVALIVIPLLSDTLLRSSFIKLLAVVLISTGIGGNLYSITDAIKSSSYWGDVLVIILQHIIIIFLLVSMGINILKFKKKQTD
ncbi:MAG: hypothetical protein C4581_05435 [Nitrospiraceae bacterium]|nr:MAG: hypothetical protein C4581_05435 [Nitrospiraceae bacterium]